MVSSRALGLSHLLITFPCRRCIHESWRNGRQDAKRIDCTENHPFLGNAISFSDKASVGRLSSNSSSRSSSVINLDPLSFAFDGMDPLSQFAIESEQNKDKEDVVEQQQEANVQRKSKTGASLVQMESWSSRRAAILNKYTTTERLSIVTSFLTGGETSE